MEEREEYVAGQADPTDQPPENAEFEEGPLPPPEQGEPQQEPPASALMIRMAAPGVADIVSMQTSGEVTLGQLAYAGMFLATQALINWQMPAMHEVVKVTVMEALTELLKPAMAQALTELFKPKIEPARGDFRIPPDLLRGIN